MTYSKLLELIEAMSDEQKAMNVVVACMGEYYESPAVVEVVLADAEWYPAGQVVLLT